MLPSTVPLVSTSSVSKVPFICYPVVSKVPSVLPCRVIKVPSMSVASGTLKSPSPCSSAAVPAPPGVLGHHQPLPGKGAQHVAGGAAGMCPRPQGTRRQPRHTSPR